MAVNVMNIDDKLTGMSLKERHKNFNLLIKEASTYQVSSDTLQDFARRSYAEQVFITKLVVLSRDAKLLCELFKSQNQTVVSFALTADWFFKGDNYSEFTDPEYMVTQVFPDASYHSISRIINALSVYLKNETLAQRYYEKIYSVYGQEMAVRLLPACNIDFIKSVMINTTFDVPFSQLKYIFRKDSKIILDYVERQFRAISKTRKFLYSYELNKFKPLWLLIAEHHLDFVMDAIDKYSGFISIKLGEKLTLHALRLYKERIIENPKKYTDFLKVKTIVRKINGDDLEKFFSNQLPDTMDVKRQCYLPASLILLKPELRLNVLKKIYLSKYDGRSFMEIEDLESNDIFRHIPAEERYEWVYNRVKEVKKYDRSREEYYLMYYPIDESIAKLKVMNQSASEYDKRLPILKRMLDCCRVNNDTNKLLDVLKYTATRHRNDQFTLKYEFLEYLRKNFTLYELTEEHWAVINEMLDFLCTVPDYTTQHWKSQLQAYLEQYIHFCMRNEKEFESIVDKYIDYKFWQINLLVGVEKYEFILLEMFTRKFKQRILENPDSDDAYYRIDRLVGSFSERSDRKHVSMADCEWLMNILKEKFARGSNDKIFEGTHYLYKQFLSDTRLKKMFADLLVRNTCEHKLLIFLLKYDIQALINNTDHLLNRFLNGMSYSGNKYIPLFYKIRTYFMKPLGDGIIKDLETRLIANTEHNEASYIITLSLLLNNSDSDRRIKCLLPSEIKIKGKINKKDYENGEVLGTKLRFINPPVSMDTVLHLSQGDYLKFSLPSLLSYAFKKPQKETNETIATLLKKPVSVKKHGIRLAYFLYPRSQSLELFKTMWTKEKNNTIRDTLFQRTFRLMQTSENSEETYKIWSIVKHFFSTFSEVDKNLWIYFDKHENMPQELLSDYFETCWKTLKILKEKDADIDCEISTVAENFTKCMHILNKDFSKSIILECLYSIDDQIVTSNLLPFLVQYLLNATDADSQSDNLKFTCKIFTKFIEENWDKQSDNGVFKYRKPFVQFVNSIYSKALTNDQDVDPINLLREIQKMISSVLPWHATFSLQSPIDLTIKFLEILQTPPFLDLDKKQVATSEVSSQVFETFGEVVSKYLDNLCCEHGPEIGLQFVKIFNQAKGWFYRNGKSDILELFFLKGLVKGDTSKDCLLMAINMMPNSWSDKADHYDIYESVFKEIMNKSNGTLKIIINDKIELNSSDFAKMNR